MPTEYRPHVVLLAVVFDGPVPDDTPSLLATDISNDNSWSGVMTAAGRFATDADIATFGEAFRATAVGDEASS